MKDNIKENMRKVSEIIKREQENYRVLEDKEDINEITAGLKIAGIASGIICVIAGTNMISIVSVAGDTIMEAYYHAMGYFAIGFGIFAGGLLYGMAKFFEKVMHR